MEDEESIIWANYYRCRSIWQVLLNSLVDYWHSGAAGSRVLRVADKWK